MRFFFLFPFFLENNTLSPLILSQIKLLSSQIRPPQHSVYHYSCFGSIVFEDSSHEVSKPTYVFVVTRFYVIVWHFYVVYVVYVVCLCVYLF